MKTEKKPLWIASWQSLVTLARAVSWSSGVNVILNWGGVGDAGAAGEYDKFSSWSRIRGRSQEMFFLPLKS